MAQRCVELTRYEPGPGTTKHVVITLDDGETMDDAANCLRQDRWDWHLYDAAGNDAASWREAVLRVQNPPKPMRDAIPNVGPVAFDQTPKPPIKVKKSPLWRHEYEPHNVEADIPHNWGIGLGEGLDYLDAETRQRIYEAVDCEYDAIDDTMLGASMGNDPGTIPVLGRKNQPKKRRRRQEHGEHRL